MADMSNCIMVRFDDTGLFVEAHPRKRNAMKGYVYVGGVGDLNNPATAFNFKGYQKTYKARMAKALGIIKRGNQVRVIDSDDCHTKYDVRRIIGGQYVLRVVEKRNINIDRFVADVEVDGVIESTYRTIHEERNNVSYYILDKHDMIDHLIWVCSTDEEIVEVDCTTLYGEVQQYIWIKTSEFSTTQRFCKNV